MLRAVLFAQINAYALSIVCLILFRILRQRSNMVYDQRLFACLTASIALMLLLDTGMWVSDMKPGAPMHTLNQVSSFLYYMASPFPPIFWALFANYKIHGDSGRTKKLAKQFALLWAIYSLVVIWNLRSGILYSVGPDNVYRRGPYFLAMAVFCYLFLLIVAISIGKNRKKIGRENVVPLALFPVLPVLGGLYQTMHYGSSVLWVCMTLSVLIIFAVIQNKQINTDHLTGLCNRRQFHAYYRDLLARRRHKYLAGILVDIDRFKHINDRFGHLAGDAAICSTAQILLESVKGSATVARYSGDEFAVLFETDDEDELSRTVESIRSNLAAFNARQTLPHDIGLSIGFDFLQTQSDELFEVFFNRLDRKMYLAKTQARDERSAQI